MDKSLEIFKENDLYGAKDNTGRIVIPPQYIEMYPFSCGLSLVRNVQYQYAYINKDDIKVVNWGNYKWCDPQFICGYARVIKYNCLENTNQWGIIDTFGNIVVPLIYDKIWPINEEYITSIKAFKDDIEEKLNLLELTNNLFFDGMTYIKIYSIEAFKKLVNCKILLIKVYNNTNQLYFTYGSNIGSIALDMMAKEPVVSIVANSRGEIFPLLMEKADIGKTRLPIVKITPQQKEALSKNFIKKSFCTEKVEEMRDNVSWYDPYEDEDDFYDDWSREEIENGLADAFEDDKSNYWNIT